MLQGIQVGPLFITNNPVIWNTILVALLCCNILMYLVMFFPVKLLAKIVLIPQERLYPVVLMMCTVGAYATLNGRMFDVWCLLLFGIVGLLIKKFHFPRVLLPHRLHSGRRPGGLLHSGAHRL